MATVNNRQIAKNTIFLYIRMLLIMAVSLYTSRVILKTLGVEDYGIYNLVAGFVTLFTFISNALVSAIQTFLNVALGKQDEERFKRVFSMSITIMFLTSALIVVLGETLGLWFVKTQLNIPIARQSAALWVYQLSLATFVINILRSPYNAAIIAYERMSFYAYVSIVEVLLRLGLVFSLLIIPFDKLISYTGLYMVLMMIILFAYIIFCKKRLIGCKYRFEKDNVLFKELVTFSGWSLLGQSAVVAASQGEAIFINRFFTVAVNAAIGVSAQLTGAIETFITNFQIAFNPQLVKSYTDEDKTEHNRLLIRASKFSFYLQLLLTLPIVFNIETVLKFWLGEVPQYSDAFCVFVLCGYLLAAISIPLKTSIYAGGNIRDYEILRTVVFAIGLCCSYFALKIGNPPYYVAIVGIGVQALLLVIRLYFAKRDAGISIWGFIKGVAVPCLFVGGVAIIVPFATSCDASSFLWLLIIVSVDVLYIALVVWFLGLSNSERKAIISSIKGKLINKT